MMLLMRQIRELDVIPEDGEFLRILCFSSLHNLLIIFVSLFH